MDSSALLCVVVQIDAPQLVTVLAPFGKIFGYSRKSKTIPQIRGRTGFISTIYSRGFSATNMDRKQSGGQLQNGLGSSF